MHVAQLNVFPVKGCGGISVEEWDVGERGLRHDRRYVVVRPDGRFITQRDRAELALVATAIEGDRLVLRDSAGRSAAIPLAPHAGERLAVTVWGDVVEAILPSPEADALLSAALGEPLRIAWMPEDAERRTAEKRGLPQRAISFADATPMHIATEAALTELNARLAAKGIPAVGMERFRANVVVAGAAANQDDAWRRVTVGNVELRVTDSCKRCKVVTIDQKTAVRVSSEPMDTLKAYRFEEGPVSNGASFGQRLTVERGGTIRVGDPVVGFPAA